MKKSISKERVQKESFERKYSRFRTQSLRTVFHVDARTHQVMKSLAEKVQAEFPDLNPQLVLLGSQAIGGAAARNYFTGETSDIDMGVFIPGLQDPKFGGNFAVFQNQTAQIKAIHEIVNRQLWDKELVLCYYTNPEIVYAPALQSITQAQQMLEYCFYHNQFFFAVNYFMPTYPLENWQRNYELIKAALLKIRNTAPEKYRAIIQNIQNLLREVVKFKPEHFGSQLPLEKRERVAASLTNAAQQAKFRLLIQNFRPLLKIEE